MQCGFYLGNQANIPLLSPKKLFRTPATKNLLKAIIYWFLNWCEYIYIYIYIYGEIKNYLLKNANLFNFWSFLEPFLALMSLFGALPNICFYHTNSLMGIYFHTKCQNKAINGCLDIFNTCYSQISGIFYVRF